MKNLTKIFALTAIAAATALSTAALSLTGCTTNGGGVGKSDPLNGTWLAPEEDGAVAILKLDNGAFEAGDREDGAYLPLYRGMYAVNGGEMTMTITHASGYLVGELLDIDDTEEWYSMDELLQAAPELGGIVVDNAVAKLSYSLNGNELTLTDDWESATFTRE